MKTIAVVTATRAEYGLLRNVIKEIEEDQDLELMLLVTGTHLLKQYGYTVNEIEMDGYPIANRVPIIDQSDDLYGICKTMANASIQFARIFTEKKPDCMIVLGDRYELLPVCSVAMNARIPIVHISGGETTQGAVDEAVRHCITKMSYLHFPGCEEYRKRIIQLGESPDRVFNYGDVGVENVCKMKFMSRKELENSIGYELGNSYFSVTFHPVTLDSDSSGVQFQSLLDAIEQFPQYKFVFTKSNADLGNHEINRMIDQYVDSHDNTTAYESLGVVRYLNLLKYSCGIIGNSSSGIIEAPALHIPTINIGDRQKGRLKSNSIIDCKADRQEIYDAIQKSQTTDFLKTIEHAQHPYGGGETSSMIVKKIKEMLYNQQIDLKKKFYDISFSVREN